jgi:Protein of unknown function (DUF1501)
MKHEATRGPARLGRRTFLVASCAGLAGLRAGPLVHAAAAGAAPARSTILFFLSGGASHIDTWDLKPDAPEGYRGPFRPIATSAPGVRFCEHLPLLARQAHHLAVVNSVGATVNTNDHHAGYYYNLTGHVPDPSFLTLGNDRTPRSDDWPYVGCVVGSRRPPHPDLPNAVTLPQKPSKAPYTRPGQFAARLGVEHDPLYVHGDVDQPLRFQAPALSLGGDISARRLQDRRVLLSAVDAARRDLESTSRARTWSTLQERAWGLLASSRTADAFNVGAEPSRVRERYGETINGMSFVLARRLVEAGVPFITVFWKENEAIDAKCKSAGGWDTHGNNFRCLQENLLPEFDRAFSALVEDLAGRGLLDQTLLLVTSEMGRKPKIGDPRSSGTTGAGRDHWTHCMSVLMAGGGIRGGQTYGSSDRRAEYPAHRPVTPAHIAHTVYHAMGIEDLTARAPDGRVYNLLEEGEPLLDLF